MTRSTWNIEKKKEERKSLRRNIEKLSKKRKLKRFWRIAYARVHYKIELLRV